MFIIVDAHEDLAFNVLTDGRNYLESTCATASSLMESLVRYSLLSKEIKIETYDGLSRFLIHLF